MPSVIDVQNAHREVKGRFLWTDDHMQHGVPDHWRDHAYEFENDPEYVIRGDCDDFAITLSTILLRKYGFDAKDIRLICCLTEVGQIEGTKILDHMVCGVKWNGEYWILDNRQRDIFPMGWAGYKYYSYYPLDNPDGFWKKFEEVVV